MASEFEGKRYTTLTHMRSVYYFKEGKNYEHPPVYGIYDNVNQVEVKLKGFRPNCYEDVRQKAMELNDKS